MTSKTPYGRRRRKKRNKLGGEANELEVTLSVMHKYGIEETDPAYQTLIKLIKANNRDERI